MSTSTRERKPQQRHCGIFARERDWFGLEISVQKSKERWQTDAYLCRPIASDFGQCFRLEKQDLANLANESPLAIYHVCIQPDGHLCDCRGSHRAKNGCKHVRAIEALLAAGRLPPQRELTVRQTAFVPTTVPTFNPEELMADSLDGARQLRYVAEADQVEAEDFRWCLTDPDDFDPAA